MRFQTKSTSRKGQVRATADQGHTFYRLPKESVLESWLEQVPDRFKFVLKASRRITHIKRLKEARDETEYLLRTACVLGDRLGPILFQLPPNMKKNLDRLKEFLAIIPAAMQATFEFRHETWMDEETVELLTAHNRSICCSDADDGADPVLNNTSDHGYVRLRGTDYSAADLARWRDCIRSTNWKETYVFFKHEEDGAGPALAKRFLQRLNA